MAVNRLTQRPMIVVTANPLIGPVPKYIKTRAARIPETCVSRMVIRALSITRVECQAGRFPSPQFFADSFKDQNVRINRDTDCQEHAGDAGQC